MKLILITLLAFNTLGFFAKWSELDKKLLNCDYPLTTYSKAKKCGEGCIKVKNSFKCETYKKEAEMVEDKKLPIAGARSMIEDCLGESHCKAISKAKNLVRPDDCSTEEIDSRLECEVQNCISPRKSFYNAEYSQAWCNEITGYQMKPTGNFIFVEDAEKKTAYEASEASKRAIKEAIAKGAANMEKCSQALAFVNGQNTNSEATEAEVDQMELVFGDIREALSSGRIDKSKRLIGEVVQPEYQELKAVLLSILE